MHKADAMAMLYDHVAATVTTPGKPLIYATIYANQKNNGLHHCKPLFCMAPEVGLEPTTP
jgi:hypothetical protein